MAGEDFSSKIREIGARLRERRGEPTVGAASPLPIAEKPTTVVSPAETAQQAKIRRELSAQKALQHMRAAQRALGQPNNIVGNPEAVGKIRQMVIAARDEIRASLPEVKRLNPSAADMALLQMEANLDVLANPATITKGLNQEQIKRLQIAMGTAIQRMAPEQTTQASAETSGGWANPADRGKAPNQRVAASIQAGQKDREWRSNQDTK